MPLLQDRLRDTPAHMKNDVSSDMSQMKHVTGGDTAAMQPLSMGEIGSGTLSVVAYSGSAVHGVHALMSPMSVGRDPGCDFPIADLAASRIHARLIPGPSAI